MQVVLVVVGIAGHSGIVAHSVAVIAAAVVGAY